MKALKSLYDLHGRVAAVTGGGGHVGAAVCEALAELGASVAVLDIAGERARDVAAKLPVSSDASARAFAFDLTRADDIVAAPAVLEKHFGRLDIIVNSAALVGASLTEGWADSFDRQSFDLWQSALEVNLIAPVRLVQVCAPMLRRSGHASIINIASTYGAIGPDWRLYADTGVGGTPAAYAASKGGLIQMTRWLATTLAPEIRVNCVSPGGIYRGQSEAFVQRYVDRTPLRRMSTEEDLKGVIAFLASDLSSYVTGQNIFVDGGWTAW